MYSAGCEPPARVTKNQEFARFTYFLLGGSDVVIPCRSHIGNLDRRDRLRRQLLAISYHTVTSAGARAGTRTGPSTSARTGSSARTRSGPSTRTGPSTRAGTRAAAGPGCSVRHDSSGCRITRKQGLHAPGTGRHSGDDSDLDEHRLHFSHDHVGCHWVELGNSRTRPTVLIRVPDRWDLSVPLRHSSGNGRKGCRSLTPLLLRLVHLTRAQ